MAYPENIELDGNVLIFHGRQIGELFRNVGAGTLREAIELALVNANPDSVSEEDHKAALAEHEHELREKEEELDALQKDIEGLERENERLVNLFEVFERDGVENTIAEMDRLLMAAQDEIRRLNGLIAPSARAPKRRKTIRGAKS